MADPAHPLSVVTVSFRVNGTAQSISADGDMPLLWVLRDRLGLRAAKLGCGKGLCGACSVIVNDEVARSCSLPLRYLEGKDVTTLEGLGSPERPHPVQTAWIEEQVPQCGYCQPGFIVAAVNLLRKKPHPTDEDIDRSLTNLCRCGTYERVRRAVHAAARRT
jgi:isoquinoline 1-oxidoreductase alpha subunit